MFAIYTCPCLNVTLRLRRVFPSFREDENQLITAISTLVAPTTWIPCEIDKATHQYVELVGFRDFSFSANAPDSTFLVTSTAVFYSCRICMEPCYVSRPNSSKILMNAKFKCGQEISKLKSSASYSSTFRLVLNTPVGIDGDVRVNVGLYHQLLRLAQESLENAKLDCEQQIAEFTRQRQDELRQTESRLRSELSSLLSKQNAFQNQTSFKPINDVPYQSATPSRHASPAVSRLMTPRMSPSSMNQVKGSTPVFFQNTSVREFSSENRAQTCVLSVGDIFSNLTLSDKITTSFHVDDLQTESKISTLVVTLPTSPIDLSSNDTNLLKKTTKTPSGPSSPTRTPVFTGLNSLIKRNSLISSPNLNALSKTSENVSATVMGSNHLAAIKRIGSTTPVLSKPSQPVDKSFGGEAHVGFRKNRDEVSTHESKGSPVSPSYEEEDADLDDIPVKPYIKDFTERTHKSTISKAINSYSLSENSDAMRVGSVPMEISRPSGLSASLFMHREELARDTQLSPTENIFPTHSQGKALAPEKWPHTLTESGFWSLATDIDLRSSNHRRLAHDEIR